MSVTEDITIKDSTINYNTITEEDKEEQKKHCSKCQSTNMEYCIRINCPYYGIKHYTEEDRAYYNNFIAKER